MFLCCLQLQKLCMFILLFNMRMVSSLYLLVKYILHLLTKFHFIDIILLYLKSAAAAVRMTSNT